MGCVELNKYYLGVFWILAAAMGNALLLIFTLFAYRGNVNVETILSIRFSFTAILLFLFITITRRQMNVSRSYLLSVLLLGGVLIPISSRLYLSSVKHISASLAVLCSYSYPVMVAMLCWIFEKEKFTNRTIASIIMAVLGLALVMGNTDQSANFIGILMAIGSSVCYSIYVVISNRTIKQISPIVTAAFVSLFSAITVLIVAVSTNSLNFHFAKSAWMPILGISLFSTLVPIVSFLRGLELLGSAKASVISMIEPLITFSLGSVLFHDRFSIIQWIGALFILTGAITIMAKDHHKQQDINRDICLAANASAYEDEYNH